MKAETKTELLMTVTYTCVEDEIVKVLKECNILGTKIESFSRVEDIITIVTTKVTSQEEFVKALKSL